MSDERPRCKAIRKDGEPCTIRVHISERGFCLWHDPERAEEAQAARIRGGENSGKTRLSIDDVPPAPMDLEGVAEWFAFTVVATALERLDPRVSREVTQALNGLRGTHEKLNLDKRMKEVERFIERQQRLKAS